MTEKVRNNSGQALNGAIANDDSAPAASAIAARFHPHARMIARPAVRGLFVFFTASRPRRRAAGSYCRWPVAVCRSPRRPRGGGSRVAYAVRGVPCGRGGGGG